MKEQEQTFTIHDHDAWTDALRKMSRALEPFGVTTGQEEGPDGQVTVTLRKKHHHVDKVHLTEDGEPVVSEYQAELLKRLGYNRGCRRMHGVLNGYRGLHNIDNYNQMNTDEQFSAPAVDVALRWVRQAYGVYHHTHIRHMQEGELGFTPSHTLLQMDFKQEPGKLIDLLGADLSNGKWEHLDNAIPDYDQAQSEALTDALKWLDREGKLPIKDRIAKHKQQPQ